MAETFKSDEEYIFKAEFDEDFGLSFMPTGESIVRCKECVHFEGVGFYCQIDRYVPTENDFLLSRQAKEEPGMISTLLIK